MRRRLTIVGPDLVPVDLEVERDLVLIYPGSGEEPPDYSFTTCLRVNGVTVDAARHHKLVEYVDLEGR